MESRCNIDPARCKKVRRIRVSDLMPKQVHLPSTSALRGIHMPSGSAADEFEFELTRLLNRLISMGAGHELIQSILHARRALLSGALAEREIDD